MWVAAAKSSVIVVDNFVNMDQIEWFRNRLNRDALTKKIPIVTSSPMLDWWYTKTDNQHPYESLSVIRREGERETPYSERSFQYRIQDLNKNKDLVNMEVALSKGDNRLSMNNKVDTINKRVFTSVINTLASF